MTKLYDMEVTIRVRCEANTISEARREMVAISDQMARDLPVGASIKNADFDLITIV